MKLVVFMLATIATFVPRCEAQFASFNDLAWLAQGKTGVTKPNAIPGLAYWWVGSDTLTNLGTNVTVTSWKDRIQGSILSNASSANSPTNTANGQLGFDNTPRYLTNAPQFDIGTNWTVVVFMQQTRNGNNSKYVLWGENGSNFCEVSINQTAPNMQMGGSSSAGGTLTYDGTFPGVGTNFDYAVVQSNSVAVTGASFAYTNGVFLGAAAKESTDRYFGIIGSDRNGANWEGFMQEILVYTNLLTPSQIALIHTYRTNQYGAP